MKQRRLRRIGAERSTRQARRVLVGIIIISVAIVSSSMLAIVGGLAPSKAGAVVDPHGLQSVSCPSASFCAAVDSVGGVVTFNGTSWSAAVGIDGINQLTSVSCPSASFCAAVDSLGNAVTFNGTSWSAPVDIDGVNQLTSVTCPSASSCVAVDNTGDGVAYNGSSWSPRASIDPGKGLTSVTCGGPSLCGAVDSSGNEVSLTLPGPAPFGAPNPIDPGQALESISCPSNLFCAAVDDAGQAFVYSGGWSGQSIDAGQVLRSVSCTSASFCAAVDNTGNIITYNGTSWSSPVGLDGSNVLTSLSCPLTSFCSAVDLIGNALTLGSSQSTYTCVDPANSVFQGVETTVLETPAPPTSLQIPGTFPTTLLMTTTLPGSVVNNAITAGATQISINALTLGVNGNDASANPSGAVNPNALVATANNLPVSFNLSFDTPVNLAFRYNPMTWASGPSSGTVFFTPATIHAQFTGNNGSFTDSDTCYPPGAQAGALGGPTSPPPPPMGSTVVSAPSPTPTLQVPSSIPALQSQVTPPDDAGWEISVSNTSAAVAHAVSVALSASDTVPLGFDLAQMAKEHESCHPAGSGVSCALGDLAPQATATLFALVSTTALSSGTITGSANVSSADAPAQSAVLGGVSIITTPNVAAAVLSPGVNLTNTSAPLSGGNPVKIIAKLPKKVRTSTLAPPAHRRAHRGMNAAGRLSVPVPVAVILKSIQPSLDTALCPDTTATTSDCVGSLAVVGGNFASYADKSHPIKITVTFLLPLNPGPTHLFMDKQLPGVARVDLTAKGKCVKSAGNFDTPCLVSEKTVNNASGTTIKDTVYFVGNDPVMGRN